MKKLALLLGFSLVLSMGLCSMLGCSETADIKPVKITAEEAYNKISGGEPVIVVDVGTAEQYAEKHISGAISVPNEEIGKTAPAAIPVSSASILVYCRSEEGSAQAAKKLTKMGYTSISDFGSLSEWKHETEQGKYAPPHKDGTLNSFLAYDLEGMPVDESVFANHKMTVINIWATFCGPCINEMPELGELAAKYAERGVQFIGIAADVQKGDNGAFPADMIETARDLVAKTGADYLHLLPSDDLMSAKINEVEAVPETIFVDGEGDLIGKAYLGSRSGSEWTKIIDKMLEDMGA